MIEAIVKNEWLQLIALVSAIATGIWFFWEKIRDATKAIREWAKHFWQKTPPTIPSPIKDASPTLSLGDKNYCAPFLPN